MNIEYLRITNYDSAQVGFYDFFLAYLAGLGWQTIQSEIFTLAVRLFSFSTYHPGDELASIADSRQPVLTFNF